MIVKRMVKSLKRQDWLMVTIEFILVIVGVLLGFQINSWGNERSAARSRLEATARLLDEAEQDVAYLRSTVEEQRQRSANLNFVLERVEEGRIGAGENERFAMGLFGLEGTLPIAPPSSVYQDIVSSGTLAQIGDAPLRAKIGRYHASLAFEDRVQSQAQLSMPTVIKFPAIDVRYRLKGNLGQTQISGNFDGVRDDPVLRKELIRAGQVHVFLLRLREQALDDAIAMCVALGQAVGRTCNQNRAPTA